MRILHTSDWHLGRLFHQASLQHDQEQALSALVDLVDEAAIDLVIVAGDLYDRSVPPASAVELFDETLLRLHRTGVSVVAISGNHDSGVRVGYADRLLSPVGLTLRGDPSRAAEPVEIHPRGGGRPAVVYPVPYLDPPTVAHLVQDGASGDPDEAPPRGDPDRHGDPGRPVRRPDRRFGHQEAMAWALDRARNAVPTTDAHTVVVAHTFVAGGRISESERELTVGTIDRVGLPAFKGFDYVALGHLHEDQTWDEGRIAYSGSPLPYSFSEERHHKSVRIVELGDDGSLRGEAVPLDVGRPLRTLTGELDHLLADPALAEAEEAWVRVRLTDRHLPLQAMHRLRARFPHAVELHHQPALPEGRGTATGDRVETSDPMMLALRFIEEQRGFPAEEDEQGVLSAAFDAVRGGSAGGEGSAGDGGA